MQYPRIFEPARLGKALLVGMALCLVTVGSAEAKRKIRHPHQSHHVSRSARDDGGITSSPRYAAFVIDDKTGRVLYAKNENELRHPASLTKMMTLYVLFEDLERRRFTLGSRFTASAKAAAQSPSKLGIRPGQTISAEDAIRALVTRSANDVAVTIAENVAGSEQAFAKRMTATARRIGMSRTTFLNASGLPNADQWTTAKDMVTLGRALQERFPVYYRYFNTRSFAWGGEVIGNHNRLLGRIEGVDGIKTGYTQASGFNLVSSLRRDGRHLVASVLGGSSGRERDDHMASLLTRHIGSASSGAKVSSVLRLGKSADASDDFGADDYVAADPIATASIAPASGAPVALPVPAPTPVAEAPAPAPAAPAPAEPVKLAALDQGAPTAPIPTRSLNRPRIAHTEVIDPGPLPLAETRGSNDHGAAVAMARAILLPQSTAPAAAARPAAAPEPRVAAVAPRAPEPEAPPPSLAHATVSMSEMATLTTGSVPARAAEPAPAPAPAAAARPAETAAPSRAVEAARAGWLVQIGAFDEEAKARAALVDARVKGGRSVALADAVTEQIGGGSGKLWRARFAGFESQNAADGACKALKRKKISCLALRQ